MTTAQLPTIDELYELIGDVPTYPVSAGELAKLSQHEGADQRVVNFYRSFPEDEVFLDEDDLVARSEQVQIMGNEAKEQPWEELRSPQE